MYVIIGKYQGQSEIIDQADTLQEARYLVGEYQLAYGPQWAVTYRKARKSDDI